MVIDQSFFITLFILTGLVILTLVRNIRQKEVRELVWFCELSPLLLIIGLLFRNTQFIKGVINIGLFTQTLTLITLALVIFSNFKIVTFKRTKSKGFFYIAVSFLLHILSVNLAFIITIYDKATPLSLVYSIFILASLFIVTYIFTDHEKNINFIESLDFANFKPRYYKYVWLILAFLLIVLPTYFFQNWITSLIK